MTQYLSQSSTNVSAAAAYMAVALEGGAAVGITEVGHATSLRCAYMTLWNEAVVVGATGTIFPAAYQRLPSGMPVTQPVVNSREPYVKVFHKGDLRGGLSSIRPLSTGVERGPVEALARPGKVTEFNIPKSVLENWKTNDMVREIRDLDAVTGVINEELRFAPQVAKILETFIVQ